MDILIVGAGNMGRGIATRLLAGGHPVHIADRDPSRARELAAALNADATGESLNEGPGDARVVVLALPYPANRDLAASWRDSLAGKIVVDIANPVDFATFDDLATPPNMSSAEEVAAVAPAARVVKAFNTTFANNLARGVPMDVFIATDDAEAGAEVADLVRSGGLRPVFVGGLKHARELEGFQLLHMRAQEEIDGRFATTVGFAAVGEP